MPRPPEPDQVDWFARWLGTHGTHHPVPPGHEATLALLHPGTRFARDEQFPPFRGPALGRPGVEQRRLLGMLLLAATGSRAAATSATWDPTPGVRPQRPLDLGTRVRAADLEYLLVGGRLDSLVWTTWEQRLVREQPLTALWADDHSWCVWSDPRMAYTVLAGSADLCERALEAPGLRGVEVRLQRG